MAFEVTASGLWKEIRAAESARDKRLAVLKDSISAYTSPFYYSETGDVGDELDYNPENHHFEFLRRHVPELISGVPRQTVKSRRAAPKDPAHDMAKGVQHAGNVWAVESNLDEGLLPCAVDFYFNHTVGLVRPEKHPYLTLNDGAEAEWPSFVRLSPRRFIRDPQALTQRECKFLGHMVVMDKEDLLTLAREKPDDGWDVEAIEALAEQTKAAEFATRPAATEEDPDRNEVTYYEMLVFDVDKPDGKGHPGHVWYTLGVGVSEDGSSLQHFIREPFDYWGPREGPYIIGDQFVVPDDPFGLSSLVANEGQVRDLNQIVRSALNAGNNYKRLILVDDTDPEFMGKVEAGDFDLVVPVSGLEREKVVSVEIGGITEQMMALIGDRRDRLDRGSSMGDANRGVVTGRGTATEVAQAAETTDIGTNYDKRQWSKFVRGIFMRVDWFLAFSKKVRIALDQDAAVSAGAQIDEESGLYIDPKDGSLNDIAAFQGGDWTEKDWGTAQIEIEPLSMEYVSQANLQRMALLMHQTKVADLPLMAQFPDAEFWQREYELLGDMLNIPNFAEGIDSMVQLAGSMMGVEGQPAQPMQYPSVNVGGRSLPAGRTVTQAPPQPQGQNLLPGLGLKGNTAGAQAVAEVG